MVQLTCNVIVKGNAIAKKMFWETNVMKYFPDSMTSQILKVF